MGGMGNGILFHISSSREGSSIMKTKSNTTYSSKIFGKDLSEYVYLKEKQSLTIKKIPTIFTTIWKSLQSILSLQAFQTAITVNRKILTRS